MKEFTDKEFDALTVQHYISVVANKIHMLIAKVNEVSQHDYTSSSPLALSEIVIRILSYYLDHLQSLSQKAEYQPPGDVIRGVSTINRILVSIIPELIQSIESADNDTNMASIIEAYQYIGNQVQYGTQMIIYPTWEYNASSAEVLQNLRLITQNLSQESIDAIFSGAPKSFVVMTFPKAEEPIILRQALIAHEVGHFIEESIKDWLKSLFNERLFDPQDMEKIITTGYGDKNNRVSLKIIEMIEKMISPWLKEIVCDFFAVSMVGPAYLFAFDEISFSPKYTYPRKLSLSHPPDQLRKTMLREWVLNMYLLPIRESEDFQNFSEEEMKVYEKIAERVDIICNGDETQFDSIGNSSALSSDVLAAIYSTLKIAIEKASRILVDQKYQTIKNEQWVCTVQDLIDAIRLQNLLAHGLTPTELYVSPPRDPSFAAVLNSGWFHFIFHENDYLYFNDSNEKIRTPDQITLKHINLQNLVAKAIESLHFKREFNRRQGKSRE